MFHLNEIIHEIENHFFYRVILSVSGEMVISSTKYEVATYPKSIFEVRMRVLVRNLRPEDIGSYKCIAKNSLGEVESSIRLYGKRK